MKKHEINDGAILFLAGLIAVLAAGPMAATAQMESNEGETQYIQPDEDANRSEFVTINVKDANIAEVLKAYSLQTGQSIVVGPEVVSDNVNVRLNNIPWQDALDVILKPYGFGYRVVGDTIVISRLENIVTVEGIEPLVSKVFKLKFLDAYDIKEVCEAQLSGRGKISIPANKGLPRWEFGGGNQSAGSSSAQSSLGVVKRDTESMVEKSKLLIVTDVPSVISGISTVIEELDQMPSQVLIESRFIEIDTGLLRDLGLDFASGANGLNTPGVQVSNPGEANQWGVEKNDSSGLTPSAFTPLAETLSGSLPYNSGLQLLFSRIGGENFEVMLHALEEDGDVKVLSAPRVLTQNNQEAAILVGEKFPIIESQNSSGGADTITSTTLKYYENIGIQLNVIPQVCEDNHINMIVHPIVSSIDGYEQGVVSSGATDQGLTRYPRLKVREAQTQILLKSEDSVAIGGLQSDSEQKSIFKIPLLGDIPFLGRLFRRETTSNKQVELVILIKASIVDNQAYANSSANMRQGFESKMKLSPVTTELGFAAEPEEPQAAAVVEAPQPEAGNKEVTATDPIAKTAPEQKSSRQQIKKLGKL